MFDMLSSNAQNHEEIARKIVGTMANILETKFGIDRSVALSLSWVGLKSTSIFANPPANLAVPLNHDTVATMHRYNNVYNVGRGCN